MKKTYLSVATLALSAIFAITPALAQTTATTNTTTSTSATAPIHMSVAISRSGKAKIEGTISSVSGNTISVTSWGGTWNVDASNARIQKRFGGKTDVSTLTSGDMVVVWGTASSDSLSVTGTLVRDMSLQSRNVHPYGTVSSVTTTGFTLTTGAGKTYNVTADSNTKVTLNNGTGSLTDLGAVTGTVKATVWGTLDRNDSDLSATRVRARTLKTSSRVSVHANTNVQVGQ